MTSALSAQSLLRVDTNVAVPMRDGVVLRADIWRPTADGRRPTLVYRTPYGKHQATAAFATARKAVARGYAVVLQDVRGRYASDGEFLPYQQEGKDGYDTIEWAARQAWSNGSVGTFGLSYPGAAQWLAAIENPPPLMAMVPAMTFASPNQFWYSNGVWDLSWVSWINANIRADRVKRLGGDTALRAIAPWYFEWQRHPPEDVWWDWAELRGKYGRTNAAVLNFSAWHDDAYGPHGAINNFVGLVTERDQNDQLRTGLIMGPWTHGVPRMNRTTAGERDFGQAGVVDYDEIVLRWMDQYVRRIENGVEREMPVRIFVMGSNQWIAGNSWPLPGTRQDTVVLNRPGSATTIVSEPANPVADPYAPRAGAHDYRAFASDKRIAVFETRPLDADLHIVGAMAAEMHVSVDATDADIWAKVYDVAPDGTALNLMSPGLDVVRLSYRNGVARREPLVPGQVYRVRLGDLLTANTFKKGHRIRVAVMTSFAPWFEPAARAARVTIHHSSERPFRLVLPVLPASAMLSAK
ncbi:MAG: CocE/NonD family hydrolase [Gemmatimonadaceae bacterium]